ncbi:hypothetical protein GGD81_002073 [Rhodobium orientis]|uniref:CheA signal transduction histidine kinase n=1 Tax=Rhodobium orientis TaxID=34017 RepID=A0A327JTJ8_9HYPH|nr:hypothetical protein [Rhodobium orientis]MBB4303035.1 hypothetical protein [Rhodobium orientis]MBK5949594.1 hypothetical protein [Rhodobium orientis]RAI29381.1 hypothetical protein CH339_03605 [Rhodobium orientis]
MADYYAILKRALDALPENTGEARRAVYEKARSALVTQLKSVDPPLAPSEITKQRLALEESIRKVESETARALMGSNRPRAEVPKPVAPASRVNPEATARTEAPKPAGQPDRPRPPAPPRFEAPPRAEPPVKKEPAAAPPAGAVAPPIPPARPKEDLAVPVPAPAGEPDRPEAANDSEPPKKARGVDVFRRAVKAAGALGAASGKASKSAREVLDATEKKQRRAERQRQEPELPEHPPEEPGAEPMAEPPVAAAGEPHLSGDGPADGDALAGTEFHGRVAQPLSSRTMWMVAAAILLVIFVGVAGWIYAQRDLLFGSADLADDGTVQPTVTEMDTRTTDEPALAPDGLAPKITDRLPSVGGENGAAPDAKSVRTMRVRAPGSEGEDGAATEEDVPAEDAVPVEGADDAALSDEPAETSEETGPDEVAPDEQSATEPAPEDNPAPVVDSGNTVGVGQRAILYEENTEPGAGNTAYNGSVVWSLTEEPSASGGTDTVLHAHADIPDKNMAVDVKLRPNRDTALPAPYTIEIAFTLPEDFEGGGIANVPGLILKTSEAARGDALRGASARVLENLFWIALSQNDVENDRNQTLLKDRGWIDIPVLFETDKRAILTLEKGAPGDRMIEQAFAKWQAG